MTKQKTIGDIARSGDQFRSIMDAAANAAERAFAKTGLPVPDYLEDIIKSVMLDAVDEILYRVREVEDRD